MTPRTIEPISSSPRDASPRIEQRLPEAVNTSSDKAEPKSSTSSPLYDVKPGKKSKRVTERAYTLSTLDHIPRALELPVITFPSEAKAYRANVVSKGPNCMADELEEPALPCAVSIELDDTSVPLAQTNSPCLTELVMSDAPSELAEPEGSSIAEVDDDTDELAFDGERVRAAIASALDILPQRFSTFSQEEEEEEREVAAMEHETEEVLHANEDVLVESELATEEVEVASEKEELRTEDGEIVNDQTDSRPSTGFTQDDFFPSPWATTGIILDDESMDIERELVLEQLELLYVHTNDDESSSLDHYRLPTEQSDVDDPPIFEIFTNTPRSEPPEPDLEISTARKPELLETEELSTHLARILALCRDVHLTTVEMTQRLDLEVARSSSPLPSPFVAPHLSTRYLERELKTLRRYFHNWHTVCLEKQHRLACLRDSWAIRRITRAMWNWHQQKQQKRAAERQQQLVRASCCIQRSWRAALARRQCRVRQQLFHEHHRAFKRVQFFTRLCQRHKRRVEAQLKLQRWWKRVLRRKRARERMLAKARADKKRRATAAKQLHTFVTQQHLRHKLAQALETNRRLAFKQQLQITKARSEEEKRRQLEAKRRTELQVVMKQALHEMERKWREAEAEKTRLLAEQAEKERTSREMEAQRQRRQAKETIQAFLTLQILRKRMVDANRAKEETLRKQQAEEQAHRKQLAANRAQQLLATRVLHWQLTRQQTQAERERRRWHEEQQIQAKKTAAHVIRQFVTLRVSEYCAKAEQTTLVSKQKTLLKAKERELSRIKHSSARERVNAWLSRCVRDRRLEAAAREACDAAVRQQQAMAAERRRCESEQRIQHWLVSQLQRQQARQAQAVTKQKRQEAQRLERERQEVAREDERAKTLMHHERAIAQLQRQMEEERERIVALERRLQSHLVERLVADKLTAEKWTLIAFASAVKTFHSEHKRLETAVKAKQLRIRSIERRGWYKWRQWFIGRQARTEITKEALWPTRDAQAPLISTATNEELESEARRSLRLFELRCIASARKLQRCWRSWQRRLRQRRRQSVKHREDELVHEHKARKPTVSAPIIDDRQEDAAWLLQDWWQHVWERRELWYTVTIENSVRLTVYFKAGRAWLTEGGRRFSDAVGLQFDRSVTRKLLEIVTSSAHSREDILSAMEDIALDSAPLLTTARGSPRTQQLVNGASFLPVDELELPRFCSRTRQMNKVRSMHKRQQLLDAKAATGNYASVASMTIFDAVETASVDDASFLLQQGVDLHRLEAHTHRTALHALAFCTESLQMRLGMLDFLLERAKINVNARDVHGDTALTLFAARGHAAMIQHILERSSTVDWRALNQDGRNPLHCACEQDQIEVAVLLQQLFALDSKKHKTDGEVVAPTQTALLLELHRPDSGGRTPLHVLAEHGYNDCLRSILSALSSELRELLISRVDPLGRTPLLTAIRHSHVEFVTTLLEFSASVLARDSRLRSVLHYAVDAVDAIALTTLLVEKRADLQSLDERGDSVLHYAAITGRVAVVRHLSTLGADPRVLNSDHESPAQVAVLHGHMECARLLLVVSTEEDKVLRGLRLDSPSAKSYCFPVASAAAPREKPGYWEELHQDVELVEESGHFSSEDEGETSKGWDSD
ncbi:hypothetical protein Poli38472_005737 [Pythium oligandrum]|uniref:Uncharacterized protein n=1 Tax=Pythium oligandrum TaxID=41045 RepID=A0A8K1CS69_PYTOL|nr:hypothetical protein Poli38472_005737 [Pythium oligandrum]|eukprot:TMW68269.1 hypothetical protein Poli38472_005737 [Pythium oligandrum]